MLLARSTDDDCGGARTVDGWGKRHNQHHAESADGDDNSRHYAPSSACQVFWPTIRSTTSALAVWKALTAASVLPPAL